MPDGSNARSSVTKLAYLPPGGAFDSPAMSPEEGFRPASDEKTVISKRPLAPPPPMPATVRPAEVGRSLVGESLGHFHLEEFVGGGGMGAVFRAVDTTLGRTVAVKVVSNQNADEDMLRRFRNEAQSAARLDHPNIARVYYVGEEKGWSYIVFEFIEGVNIRDLVQLSGPLPVADVVSYTLQIAEALEHAAERDVVHRDIKPSNILVMPDGRSKLVDMGLARLHQVDSPSQDLTETGVTLGTFDYISPEQARDPRSADVRSDMYSLGCTMYYMLTGSPPFPEGTVLQKLLSHSSDPPPDPRELRVDLDDDLCAIALKLMAKLPGQRYQSPGELIDRLLLMSDRLGLPHERRYALPAVATTATWHSFVGRQLPWIIPLIVLVCAVFIIESLLSEPLVISHDALRPFPGEIKGPAGTSSAPATPDGATGKDAADSPNDSTGNATSENNQSTKSAETNSSPSIESGSKDSGANELRANPTRANDSRAPGGLTNSAPSSAPAPTAGTPAPAPESSSTTTAPPIIDRNTAADENRSSDEATNGKSPADERTTSNGKSATNGKTAAGEPNIGNAVPMTPRAPSVVELPAPTDSTLLTVSPESSSTDPHVVQSLDAAFLKLASAPQVETIELRFRQRTESALTLAPRSKEGELTIRAGNEHNPIIIFRPTGDARDRNLFKVIGGKVNFIGIHFRVELSNQVSDDWSLFQLKDTGRITFTDCTLTIRNDRGGTATFFSIEAPSPSKTMMMPTETAEVPTGPLIELRSCVLRGDANVVRAMNGLPFRLNWSQGFLATSHTAVVARGLPDTNGTQLMSLNFSNVTGSLGAGLCLIDLDGTAPVLPDLRIQTTNCIWVQSDPESPLVEHRGVENVQLLAQNLFRYVGDNNRYPNTRVMWRIQPKSGELVIHRWREPPPDNMWYKEASIDKGVRWKRPPPEGRSTHTYTFRDFVLESELETMAGFEERALPEPREPDPEASPVAKPAVTNRPPTDTPL